MNYYNIRTYRISAVQCVAGETENIYTLVLSCRQIRLYMHILYYVDLSTHRYICVFTWNTYQSRKKQCNLLFDCIIIIGNDMNYNIRTFFIYLYCSVSLEKRARVDSCQRAIIVFECNIILRKIKKNTKQRHDDKLLYNSARSKCLHYSLYR